MNSITEGSQVHEKDGGPTMTVKYFRSGNRAFCEWQEGDKVRGATFPVSSLRLATPALKQA